MSLLLVVVLLFFSGSCSVSSHQYYVSDDCSSVTQSPCNPLSVYAGDMSHYSNSIFYFIGTSYISIVDMTAVKNVTLHGLDHSPVICCRNEASLSVHKSSHITFSNISVINCPVVVRSSNNITITSSFFITDQLNARYGITAVNDFDVTVSSSVFAAYDLGITYMPLAVCSSELLHYSLILINVNFTGSQLDLNIQH
uniref:Uncharacterized protein n=1 Tax=Amphimedon queenslandica TaxID=400682 RepID=A0A1X7TZJ0_AMPQE